MLPLRELLLSMTADYPPEAVVDEFVTFCRKTAVVLLRKKIAGGKLSLNRISLSIDDLALDCVADLFSRNAEGSFVQLQVYLRGMDVGKMSEAELMSHMRRLVFAKVDQGIFRIYHEIDPSLSKIIRNIKISIHALEHYTIVDRFGEPYIVPAACDPLGHLPLIEPAILKEELRQIVGKSETIPNLMAHLSRCLREQEECCRLVPMVQVALVFRSLFSGADVTDAIPSDAENLTTISDATEVISRACLWVKERAYKKYVDAGKVSEEVFCHYFKVVEAALLHAIVDRDGEEIYYYDELCKFVPGMTKEGYKAFHKSKIEYLGRIAHRRALKELKKIF